MAGDLLVKQQLDEYPMTLDGVPLGWNTRSEEKDEYLVPGEASPEPCHKLNWAHRRRLETAQREGRVVDLAVDQNIVDIAGDRDIIDLTLDN